MQTIYPSDTEGTKWHKLGANIKEAVTAVEQVRALLAAPIQIASSQAEDSQATPGSTGFPMLGVRHDSDAPTADDGDWTWLKLDEEGRLKVATKPASITPTVGDIAALNSTVVCDARRASNVVFHVKNVGTVTMAAGTFVFEASLDSTNGTDGTWFGVQAARSNANTAANSNANSFKGRYGPFFFCRLFFF